MEFSIVLPVYNEGKSILPLYMEIKKNIKKVTKSYELIFIDDGSTDNSFEVLKQLRNKDRNVKILKFQKNYGKGDALAAGFKHSQGKYIFTLDSDLQDDPSEIPKFVHKLKSGCDLVVGHKYNRKDSIFRILFSKIFNTFIRLWFGLKIRDSDSNYRLMKKEVSENIFMYSGLYRYIPVIAHERGFKITEVKVNHRKRKFGKSKYGPTRLYTGFLDLITVKFLLKFNKSPMHVFAFPGLIFTGIGFILALYMAYIKIITNQLIGDRPLLLFAILLMLFGIQFTSIGLLGEMINSKNLKEDYVIREKLL